MHPPFPSLLFRPPFFVSLLSSFLNPASGFGQQQRKLPSGSGGAQPTDAFRYIFNFEVKKERTRFTVNILYVFCV